MFMLGITLNRDYLRPGIIYNDFDLSIATPRFRRGLRCGFSGFGFGGDGGWGATVEQRLRLELGMWAANPFKETNAELLTSIISVMK